MANPILKAKIDRGDFIFAPGIQDMITAVVAEKIGFDVIFASGFWLNASAYGLPDTGIATYTQMLDRMATLVKSSSAAVIADADTGFGGLLNVHHTVRGYEAAGVSAIQMEDQEFPKKCGHAPFKRVIPCDEMVDKIRVAVDARCDSNMLIIARTDALQSEGLHASIDRANAYREAGADILFIEAMRTDEEMQTACQQVNGPMMVNMANGGHTPMRTAPEIKALGFAIAIAPSLASLAAAQAVENALRAMVSQQSPEPEGIPIFDFKEFCALIGFEAVWDFEKKWGRNNA